MKEKLAVVEYKLKEMMENTPWAKITRFNSNNFKDCTEYLGDEIVELNPTIYPTRNLKPELNRSRVYRDLMSIAYVSNLSEGELVQNCVYHIYSILTQLSDVYKLPESTRIGLDNCLFIRDDRSAIEFRFNITIGDQNE